jgi:menaquinone-dependent protoporphyrinogen IX oxidase
MKRVLILYGTYDGHTAKIANVLADAAQDAGWENEVRLCKRMPRDFSQPPYDAAVVAAPIRAGR